jgi:3-oxoacyl-[acyl-carrier protein] reductase
VFDELPLEEWDRVMRVNVTGSFLCARAVIGPMRKAGWGRIINISSATVGMGRPNFLHYVTSNAAVVGMTRSMAREVGPHGITVNALMPGLTKTEVEFAGDATFRSIVELQAIKRTETPEDLARVLLFLASPASGFITGQCIAVDGGTIHL